MGFDRAVDSSSQAGRRDGGRDDPSRARKEAVSATPEEPRSVATTAPSRSRLGSKPAAHRPERAELSVDRHAHAVRGRLPCRRRRQDSALHAPLGRHDRRKGTVERDSQRDDRGVEAGSFQPSASSHRWPGGCGGMTMEPRAQAQRHGATRGRRIQGSGQWSAEQTPTRTRVRFALC